MASRARPSRPPQRSGNPAVRGGAQSPRTLSPRPLEPLRKDVEVGLLPADGAPYPLVLRNPLASWKFGLGGAVVGLGLYLLLVQVVSLATVRLVWGITHPVDYRTYFAQAFAYERPVGLLAANLGIAVLIPISLVLVLVVHRARPRWVFSVLPGVRWRYLLICLAASLVVLVAMQLVLEAVAPSGQVRTQTGFWGFFAVIVLTSPLQAAAEEVFFRGYLMQALGSFVSRPWFGVVMSALVFALLHGTQNLALFVNRLAFGLLAGVVVRWVGGLEAGIAAHVANNLVAFLWAGLTSSIAALRAVQSLTWVQSGVQILGFVLCAAAALGVTRLMRLRTRVDLSAPRVTS